MYMRLLVLLLQAHALLASVVEIDPLCCGWSRRVRAATMEGDGEETVRISLYLRLQGMEAVRRVVREVSDPTHSSYGRYLSGQDLCRITEPLPADVAAVRALVDEFGVANRTVSDGRAFHLTLPVSLAEKMFDTTFDVVFQDAASTDGGGGAGRSPRRLLRARSYNLPDRVATAVSVAVGFHGLCLGGEK